MANTHTTNFHLCMMHNDSKYFCNTRVEKEFDLCSVHESIQNLEMALVEDFPDPENTIFCEECGDVPVLCPDKLCDSCEASRFDYTEQDEEDYYHEFDDGHSNFMDEYDGGH